MPEYLVALKASAEKELLHLPQPVANRILVRIEELAAEPRPHGARKLRGATDLWRVRVGDYRVVFAIDDAAKSVHVMRIAHRRDVYE